MRSVLEPAIPASVMRDIGRGRFTNWKRRRTPYLTGILVAYIDGFPRTIAHRVIRPGRELILATVDRPGVAAAFSGDLEAEGGIGDDVDPRRRCCLTWSKNRDIFGAVLREATKSVEKFEIRYNRGRLRVRQRRMDLWF